MWRHARILTCSYSAARTFANNWRSLAIIASITGLFVMAGASANASSPAGRQRTEAKLTRIPLSFEANQGQTDSAVKFLSRGDGYSMFLTSNSAVLELRIPKGADARPTVIHMDMLNAHRAVQVSGADKLPGVVNCFINSATHTVCQWDVAERSLATCRRS
jgi:hypothetical protein